MKPQSAPLPTHMICPSGKPVSLNDRINELLEMSEYFKEADKVLAWQLKQTANRILDWLAYEQSQRGALAYDGETGGASNQPPKTLIDPKDPNRP